ncbi:MAG: antibiotic biosynthesis monooxygenase [Ectothiorhodospiraceae bacterium AqS1]|nr:antibiotic biosynthesis monooxygenase [Ectothiorhodospiraceae bacterium AqS1]
MATQDTCCTIVPYFAVQADKMDEFKALCERFVAKTQEEEGCLYYGFSFDGNAAHCREGYVDAEALLAHLKNVASLLEESSKISSFTRIEVHGPQAEIDKLRGPLSSLDASFFVLEYGFRR